MHHTETKLVLLIVMFFLLQVQFCFAGAPFFTDDPEPTELKHFEFYFSSSHAFEKNETAGNLFNFEVNYGLIPNMQIHLLLPINYSTATHEPFKIGYANTEIGVKYRFIQETENCPQLATYPALSIPTVKNETFSDGTVKFYLPLWAQKSWGKFTTYGGGGYWFNPGSGNKNFFFSGWEAQYDLSERLMLGGEIYYQSADVVDGESALAFNLGGNISFSEKTHLLFSAGHSLANENFATAFISFLWTP